MGYRVAVVGATGAVGNEILNILAETDFPADVVVALASAKSTGKEVSYGEDTTLKVQDLAKFDFDGIDLVLSSPGAAVSAMYAPKAAAAGAVVIDNTSLFSHGPGRAAGGAGGQRRRPARHPPAASSPTRTARRSRWWWR